MQDRSLHASVKKDYSVSQRTASNSCVLYKHWDFHEVVRPGSGGKPVEAGDVVLHRRSRNHSERRRTDFA